MNKLQIDQITGNQKAKDFLKKLLSSQQKPHALLFEGIEGIGKKLCAQAFAQTLLCENKNACGICTHCNRFKDNIHPDYFFIEPDSKIKKDSISIDQIRFLLKETAYPPKLSEHRVVIIDGMELLTIEASNSILKLLEEPPNGWLFLLITSAIDKLLPTITSRTTLIKFYPLNKTEVASFLEKNNLIKIHDIDIASSLANGSIGFAYRYGNKDAEKTRQYALTFCQKALQGSGREH